MLKQISDKDLEALLTLADDRECEKLTRARDYYDTLNMKYLDLRGKDLSGRKFWNVDFTGADLSDANLNGCVFEFCEFEDVNLSGATMPLLGLSPQDSVTRISSIRIFQTACSLMSK